MKKMKKILAFLMAMTMVLGMTVTAFADEGVREETDTATVTITGLSKVSDAADAGYPTVTLYRIAKGEYDSDFTGYTWAEGVQHEVNETENREEVDIAAAAKGLLEGSIFELAVDGSNGVTNGEVVNGTYTATVTAGAYIAIITGGGTTIYNPILLTATYNKENVLEGGTIDAEENYLYGSTAVAKSSKPSIDKTADTEANDEGKKTVSVGDVITYTLTPVMPSYPTNATNKTAYIEDKMSDGLTFDYSSLKIVVGSTTISGVTADGVTTFTYENEVIAKATELNNGFRLVFLYEELEDKEIGGISAKFTDMTVKYSATLNDAAVVGGTGNENDAALKYTNNPYSGDSYDDPTKDNPDPNVQTAEAKKDEKNTIYTYQLAFHKIVSGSGENLAGAVFGIYKEGTEGTEGTVVEDTLVDTVTTADNGYAVSKKVEAGTYYVKEITAPAGYSLNTEVFKIEATYATATTTTTMSEVKYTSTKPADDATQVGWLKDDKFYSLSEKPEGDGVEAAYIEKESVKIESVTTSVAGSGTAALAMDIPNTKLSSLPSTGGIGTTIFTIGGCIIMIVAAGLFFATRRKSTK